MTIKYVELIFIQMELFFFCHKLLINLEKMCEIIYGLFGIYCIFLKFLVIFERE